MNLHINRAADVLLGGGVIAYPTEGVFGLGCMPDDQNAIHRLLAIKQREASKGLILIAADSSQLVGWVDEDDLPKLPAVKPGQPVTWIARPGPLVTPALRGVHAGIAVRLTDHPVAASLCRAAASPITSTSANLSGQPTVRNRHLLRRRFHSLVDYIVPGDCGSATGPSEIRELASGRVLRPASP